MNRRKFLKFLGVTGAVASTGLIEVFAATESRPEMLVEHYPITIGRVEGPYGDLAISAFVLPAPGGKLCRAVLEVLNQTVLKKPFVVPRMVAVLNEPSQIVINRVGYHDKPSMIYPCDIDAAIFNDRGCPVPVDWGIITYRRSLELDYQSFGFEPDDRELYLGLYFTAEDERRLCMG
jgi:hypothetical protein